MGFIGSTTAPAFRLFSGPPTSANPISSVRGSKAGTLKNADLKIFSEDNGVLTDLAPFSKTARPSKQFASFH